MDLKLEELLHDCDQCRGTGHISTPEQVQSQGSYGRRVIASGEVNCNACQGKGIRLTRAGESILEFLKALKSKGLF